MAGKRLARLLLLSAALLAARAQDDDVADEVEAPPAAAAPSPAFLVIAKASAPGLPLRRRADARCAPQTVKEAPAVVGGNVTVTLQVYNAGERCAARHQPWTAGAARCSHRRCAASRPSASRSRGATRRCVRRTRDAPPESAAPACAVRGAPVTSCAPHCAALTRRAAPPQPGGGHPAAGRGVGGRAPVAAGREGGGQGCSAGAGGQRDAHLHAARARAGRHAGQARSGQVPRRGAQNHAGAPLLRCVPRLAAAHARAASVARRRRTRSWCRAR